MLDVTKLTIQSALEKLDRHEVSSQELTKIYLTRIKKYNPKLHGLITINSQALSQAKQADKQREKGLKKPLLGIPVVIKDNFLTQGLRTTSASLVLESFVPQFDSTVVKRLKLAGVVILGKSNLDAWGHGSSGEHTDYGFTRNPYAYDRVTGGSSSGSAVSVAADFCLMGTGSDTGGSNRQPGSYCNLVGLKPTYGRTSRYGVIAMGSSTDCMGILTKTVWDSAKCLSVISGYDPFDATSAQVKVEAYQQKLTKFRKLRIGVIKEFFDQLDPKFSQVAMTAIKKLEKRGHQLVNLSMPILKYAYPIYCLTVFPEISSNLSRYDAIRFGSGRDKFGDEARRRIMIGTHALASGYQDKYYKKASQARTLLIKAFEQGFNQVDIIAGAVVPFPAFKHGERETDPLKMYLSDVLTVPANLIGYPALSVPIEFVDDLPNGLQLIARPFSETTMFQLAYQVELDYQMYKIRPELKP